MKKLLLTIGLAVAGAVAYGQGTVGFSNGAFYKISTDVNGVRSVLPTASVQYNFGLFYGIGGSTGVTNFLTTSLGVNSTSAAGVIVAALDGKTMGAVQIPGTSPNESDVWLQIKGWTSSFGTDWAAAKAAASTGAGGALFGETGIKHIGNLGPATGPGVVIWQLATGVDPTRFYATDLVLSSVVVPEPGTIALVGFGLATMLIFRRRK